MLFLILIPFAFAGEETFSNVISVKTHIINVSNASVEAFVNITTEQDSHFFSCLANSTQSWNFALKRNITQTVDISKELGNLSGTMSSLTSTCDTIARQYGDINRYFGLYTQCNTDFESCKKDRESIRTTVTELSPFKVNFEKCSVDLKDTQFNLNEFSSKVVPSIQSNLTLMVAEKSTAEKRGFLYGILGFLAGCAVMVFVESKKTRTTQREKVVGLSR